MAGSATSRLCFLTRRRSTFDGQLEHSDKVKVLVVNHDLFLVQIVSDKSLLLDDWFRASVNFLQDNLHQVRLTDR